jgi:hypothetical protein
MGSLSERDESGSLAATGSRIVADFGSRSGNDSTRRSSVIALLRPRVVPHPSYLVPELFLLELEDAELVLPSLGFVLAFPG